ncbi:MAG: Rieske 2Fe-2S domain-containing protein [Agarilytica sp.]
MAFIALEQLSRLHDGYQRAFSVEGQALLLCQLEGQVFVIENRCPHMDVSLTSATQLPGPMLRCSAHGIAFDMISGKAQGPLADTLGCLKKFPLVYEGAQVGVDLT